jgi:hypothetical protein
MARMAAAFGPPSSKVSRTLPGFGLPHPDTAGPVAGVFGAVVVDLVDVGFGVAAALGVVVGVGFGLALVVVVVFGVAFGVGFDVLGLAVVGGTDVTVTVGGAVLLALDDELDDVADPVGSSRGLTARCSAVADVGAATGIAPPPGTVVHAATAATPTTAMPRASTRVGRGLENRTTRTGAFRRTSRGSGLVRTVLSSTSGADVNVDARKVDPTDIGAGVAVSAKGARALVTPSAATPLSSGASRTVR